jgi:hypothetical protein
MTLMIDTACAPVGGLGYHALNRGDRRAEVLHHADDYRDFGRRFAPAAIGCRAPA